jgi:hypothetical protein
MQDFFGVAEIETSQQLVEKHPNIVQVNDAVAVVCVLFQILVKKFKDQCERIFGVHDIVERYNIRVFQPFQQRDCVGDERKTVVGEI